MQNTALAQQHQGGAVVEFDAGNLDAMAAKLTEMEAKLGLVQKFFQRVMVKDVDYGIIPGTQKPALLKPGAEKLCELYNYAPVIAEKDEEKDLRTGYYRAQMTIRLVHRGTGVTVAEGVGEASNHENRYRWRWVGERDIPRGVDKESLASKEFDGQYGKYYKYRIENDDPWSLWNTVLKMAKKRALVDAVLTATRSSGIFSQEEEDLDAWVEGNEEQHGGQGQAAKGNGQQKQSQGQKQGQSQGNKGASNQRAASDKQKSALFAIGKSKNLTPEDVKVIVKQRSEQDIKNLTAAEASQLIDYMQKADPGELLALLDSADSSPPGDDEVPPGLFNDQGGR